MLDLSALALVRAGSGLLLAGLAAVLVVAGSRTLRVVGLALAIGGFGLRVIVSNLTDAGVAGQTPHPAIADAAFTASMLFDLLGFAGGLLVAASCRRPVARAVGLALALLPPLLTLLYGPPASPLMPPCVEPLRNAPFVGLICAALGAGAAIAIDTTQQTDAREVLRGAFVATALALYPAYQLGLAVILLAASDRTAFRVAIYLPGVVAFVVLWIAASARGVRSARDVALAVTGAALVGMLDGLWDQTVVVALMRLATFTLLALAILRHALLGRELTLPTARRGALTSVGLVAFFAVAQIAQEFLSETMGVIVGGAAAGALIFAMIPLQRVAERLAAGAKEPAHPAVPSAGPPGERESVYRDALKLALRDRKLTRAEEAQLHRLAEALGIRPGRAHEMLAEVEAEDARTVG